MTNTTSKKYILYTLTLLCLNACSTNNSNDKSSVQTQNETNDVSNDVSIVKPYLNNNNVFIAYSNGTSKQLTFEQTDSDPILVSNKKEVFYVRTKNISGYETRVLMKVGIENLIETTLSDKKPYKDGNDASHEIFNVWNPQLALDSQHILFITEKYVNASQLVKVNILTGKWTELFSAESFEEITNGNLKGDFFVGQSDIGEHGRGIYYRIIDNSGKIIKSFYDEEAMMAFKNSYYQQNIEN